MEGKEKEGRDVGLGKSSLAQLQLELLGGHWPTAWIPGQPGIPGTSLRHSHNSSNRLCGNSQKTSGVALFLHFGHLQA